MADVDPSLRLADPDSEQGRAKRCLSIIAAAAIEVVISGSQGEHAARGLLDLLHKEWGEVETNPKSAELFASVYDAYTVDYPDAPRVGINPVLFLRNIVDTNGETRP